MTTFSYCRVTCAVNKTAFYQSTRNRHGKKKKTSKGGSGGCRKRARDEGVLRPFDGTPFSGISGRKMR